MPGRIALLLVLALLMPAAGSAGSVAVEPPAAAPAAPVQPSEGHAWVGAWLGDVVDGGVQIVALVPRGPADRAGVRSGDIIIEADGAPVSDQAALGAVLDRHAPGERLTLSLLRDGRMTDVTIELAARQPRAERPWPVPEVPLPQTTVIVPSDRLQLLWPTYRLGLRVADMTPALREHYGAPRDAGILVTRVKPDRPAARAGLRVGDVLVRMDGDAVEDADQLEETLLTWQAERPLELRVVRDGQPRVLTWDLAPAAVRPAVEAPPAPGAAPARPETSVDEREILERRLRLEIDQLQRRVEDLKRELEELRREP